MATESLVEIAASTSNKIDSVIPNKHNDRLVSKLLTQLPQLDEFFTVHKKIGEGTFSHVFVASSKSSFEKKKYAIKHLLPTSHPSRILQELRCLKDIGGRDNVVGLELCLRSKGAVAFVMPYLPHDSFSNYVTEMTVQETQLYMKNLLIALSRVHTFNIIHRDVKPSNFLYNRKEKSFLLVDFGLSHEVEVNKNADNLKIGKKRTSDSFDQESCLRDVKRPALHSLSNNVAAEVTERRSAKKRTPPCKENSPVANWAQPKNSPVAKRPPLGLRTISHVKRHLQFDNVNDAPTEVRAELTGSSNVSHLNSSFFRTNSQLKSLHSMTGPVMKTHFFQKPTSRTSHLNQSDCNCDGKPRICNHCILRKPMHAPRAGTPGYRSPEVLLKYRHQTTAVDVWAAGIIFISILSGSYPFFRAPDDITALMEMITIFGSDSLQKTARKLGRNVICSDKHKALDLAKLCERLRNRKLYTSEDLSAYVVCLNCVQHVLPIEGCLCAAENRSAPQHAFFKCGDQQYPIEAYDLLAKLLRVDPHQRYTASEALEHDFFKMTF